MYIAYLKQNNLIYEVVTSEQELLKIRIVSSLNEENPCAFTKKCILELKEYFEGKRTVFDLPVKFQGTPFQVSVWNALLDIPYGKTVTYLDIAKRIGNPKSVRAVGGAIHKNPIMIVVPCHRVIGKNKSLIGYAYGLSLKQELLSLEGSYEEIHDENVT